MPRTRIIAGLAPLILFLPVSGTASSDRLALGCMPISTHDAAC